MHARQPRRLPARRRRARAAIAAAAAILAALSAPAARGQDFVPAPNTPTHTALGDPKSMVHADFNADGNPDVAFISRSFTANANDPLSVEVLLGDGKGGLKEAPHSPRVFPDSGYQTSDLVTGQFNPAVDALPDLAVSEYTYDPCCTTRVRLLLNQKKLGKPVGDFSAPPPEIPENVDLYGSLAVGDLNGDKLTDLVLTGAGNGDALFSTGHGDFRTSTEVFGAREDLSSNCSGGGTVALGDFNDDKKLDVAIGDSDQCSPDISTGVTRYLGTGTGHFSYGQRLIVAGGSDDDGTDFVGDVNGDGHQDLVVNSVGKTHVLAGNGANAFTELKSSPEDADTLVLAPLGGGPFDAPDIVAGGKNAVRILANDGDGEFSEVSTSPEPTGAQPGTATVADFNRDGLPDVAVGQRVFTDKSVHSVAILLQKSNRPLPDTDPPETTITSGPSGKIHASKARFTFRSDEAGSTFECRLKGKRTPKKVRKFRACRSPKAYKHLKVGKYNFAVKAIDKAGNADRTPAKRAFKRR